MLYHNNNNCHSCDLTPHPNSGHYNYVVFPYYMMPQSLMVGVPVILAIVIAVIVVVERMRLPQVLSARDQLVNRYNLTFIENLLTTAIDYYEELSET